MSNFKYTGNKKATDFGRNTLLSREPMKILIN